MKKMKKNLLGLATIFAAGILFTGCGDAIETGTYKCSNGEGREFTVELDFGKNSWDAVYLRGNKQRRYSAEQWDDTKLDIVNEDDNTETGFTLKSVGVHKITKRPFDKKIASIKKVLDSDNIELKVLNRDLGYVNTIAQCSLIK